jgi:hypothetical protein
MNPKESPIASDGNSMLVAGHCGVRQPSKSGLVDLTHQVAGTKAEAEREIQAMKRTQEAKWQ